MIMKKNPGSIEEFSRQVAEVMPLMLRAFARREDNDLVRGKISFPQMIALDLAAHKSRLKMCELAGALSIQMSSATVLVDRLVRQGMLKRERDDRDRRLVWVSATAKGKKIVGHIMEQKRLSIREIFGGLNAEERGQYLAILLKVRQNLASEAQKETKSCEK